jgi:endo-alpha-1,4-polygalactosaminidase (GH114 family)
LDFDDGYLAQLGFEFEFEDEAYTDEEKQKEHRIKQLELKAFEHHDYVVFVFDNQQDWLNVVSKFNIERVDAGYGDTKKVGVGRVLNGKELLKKI